VAPLVSSPLLDVFTLRAATGRPAAFDEKRFGELLEDVWPQLEVSHPVMSIGAIESPGSATESVSRRVMLTTFDAIETLREASSAPPGIDHVVQIHHSESFPIIEQLGLLTLPHADPISVRLREGAAGRVDAVPVIGFAETAHRVKLTAFQVLWEAHRLRAPVPDARGGA
jgi:hypothetical protein